MARVNGEDQNANGVGTKHAKKIIETKNKRLQFYRDRQNIIFWLFMNFHYLNPLNYK